MAGSVGNLRIDSLVLVHWLPNAVMASCYFSLAPLLRGHRNEVAGGGPAAAMTTRVISRPKYNQATGVEIASGLPADAFKRIS